MAGDVAQPIRDIGRYRVYDEIASGGMATVSFGRLLGPVGFARTVAIKQLHAQFAKDPEFVSMFLDEARLAARIHHPNVVATLDVVASKNELVLVMDYIHGEALGRLIRASAGPIPAKITAGIICGALHGLHAAHEARSEGGEPLGIVHRDISPQNILVGVDGVPRVLDFGVAKAANRLQTTQEGHLKGKIRYMSPEQVQGHEVNRLTDLYAMAVVLFEMVTARSLFPRGEPAAIVHEILNGQIPRPSSINPAVPPELDAIILRGLSRDPNARFRDAREMALELEEHIGLATSSQISTWVQELVRATLDSRAAMVSAIESSSANAVQRPRTPPTEIFPTARTSNPVLPAYVDPSLPTGKTAFVVAPPPANGPATAIILGVFGLIAFVGLGLMLLVLRRAPGPAAVPAAAPPVVSVVAEPEPTLAADPKPPPTPPPAASSVVVVQKPLPAPPPRPVAPRAAPSEDMARSRR